MYQRKLLGMVQHILKEIIHGLICLDGIALPADYDTVHIIDAVPAVQVAILLGELAVGDNVVCGGIISWEASTVLKGPIQLTTTVDAMLLVPTLDLELPR